MAISNFFSQLGLRFGFHTSHNNVSVSQIPVKKPENQLPTDIWRHIFTFLPNESLVSCSAVCKMWRTAISVPQLANKIKINVLRIKIENTMKTPKWLEAEIGINLIELAKMEAISDPKTALQTTARLQKFMSSQAFFATQDNDFITVALLVEIAKIQATHDPENAVKTVKKIESLSLEPLRGYEFNANTFVEEVRNGTINRNFIERDYPYIPRYIHFFVVQAGYQVAYDLSKARQTLEKAKMIISTLDTKGKIVAEIAEQLSYIMGIEEQISQDRAAITKIETICSATENTTLESLKYAIDAVGTEFPQYRDRYGFRILTYLT